MQIRLDPDNAAAVKREAVAHRRIFKRRRSYADVVNQKLREALNGNSNIQVKQLAELTQLSATKA